MQTETAGRTVLCTAILHIGLLCLHYPYIASMSGNNVGVIVFDNEQQYLTELRADMENGNYENYSKSSADYENYEIDRTAFGAFVAVLRKEKGYTQRELADRLFVSDKAVSKWERGLSLPDISLLVPMSKELDVTVMELLQGRRLENDREDELRLGFGDVEQLVKKAITFSEVAPEDKRLRMEKNRPVFLKLLAISMAEMLAFALILFIQFRNGRNPLYANCLTAFGTLELLGIIFGVYFWLFMKEKLPAYYDENKISAYVDGMFHMSVPGVYFNNNNWKPITVALKKWNVAVLVLVPILGIVMSLFISSWSVALMFSMVVLFVFLLGLFVPVYVLGREKKGA